MLIGESLPFIRNYIAAVNDSIKQQNPNNQLTRLQSYWLGFIILGILVTNSFCWARYERFGLGRFKIKQMSWMFRRAQIMWETLLQASVKHIISAYGIKYGVLVIDDTDKERSKNTTAIAKAHKIRDKKTGGYINGQNLVFLLLVCEKVTLPVGFYFYESDPKQIAWRKEDARLRKKEVEKKHRPKSPAIDPNYPSKKELGLKLLSDFSETFSEVRVKAVTADTAYGTLDFMEEAARMTKQSQVISQIKKNQLIVVNNKEITVENFFKNYQGHTEKVALRGEERTVTYRSGIFKVKSHKKKYFVIALKYENEADYRYLIARDMTWRDVDIIKIFSFRWLVEVFIQDWKQYEGWNQLSKQPGEEGANRGVTLSLLSDHALLLHQDQKVLLENKRPAATVGSLREKVMMESLNGFIEGIVSSDNPKALFEQHADKISTLFELRSSIKHLRHVDMEFLQEMN
jgi:hypothetical protein